MDKYCHILSLLVSAILFCILFPASPSIAQIPISFGQTITASIDAPGELDQYIFEAGVGDVIGIAMSTASSLDPQIRLYDPKGSLLETAYITSGPGSAGIVTDPLSVAGTYRIWAADYGGTELGEYGIFVQRLNNPGLATPISFGETLSSSIEVVGEMDTYTFDATAGDMVLIRIVPLGSEIRLFGPDGSLLNEAFSTYGPASVDIESDPLPQNGTYTILACDYGGNQIGDYGIFVQRLNNPGQATPIAFGETVSGSIDVVGEVDTYTFDATTGDVVLLRMSTSGYLDPGIRLYGPDGSLLNEVYQIIGPASSNIESEPLSSSGTYTILSYDSPYQSPGEKGDYGIFVQRLNNPERTTPIAFGETLSSSIDAVGEVDTYTFDATAGDVVLIRMSTMVSLDPEIRLFSPDGSLLNETSYVYGPASVDIESDPLPQNGTYTILAHDYWSNKIGDYGISFNFLVGTPGSLDVSPVEGLNASGIVGGPFIPSSTTYTLENKGGFPIEWTLTKTQDWLDISTSGGTLGAAESLTVTVSLNADAESLSEGAYTDFLTFTNLTELNRTIFRDVTLMAKPVEGVLEVMPVQDFNPSGPPGGPFDPPSVTYTIKNVGEKPINWRASKIAYWLSLSNDHGALAPGGTVEVSASIEETANDLALGTYQDRITFTNTTNGNGNTIRDVVLAVGVSLSTISCELSKGSITLGEPLRVSGRITPKPTAAGSWVDVAFLHPGGEEVHLPVQANVLGQFEYDLECEDISRGGIWTVKTYWAGDQGLGEATSEEQTLEVAKAESRVTLNATSQVLKNGSLVDISGKFTPQPDCGGDLSGIPVELHISGPGTPVVQTVMTNDQWGHYVFDDFDGFNALGDWTVQARFAGNDAYLASGSDVLQVNVVETAGYAILVQGKIANGEGLATHNKTANFVYKQLKERGLLDEDIYYLNYDSGQQGVDDVPSKVRVQQGIEVWARDKLNAKPANLYIILIDHGLLNEFYVSPEVITAAEVDSWIDTLQGSLMGQAVDQEIIVILGFCRSGSFIDDLSGNRRVIIASAASDESSYKGPLDNDNIRQGEYFVSAFFKAVSYGKSIKAGFEEASALTETFTSSGSGEVNAPYHDDSWQHPLLDDNGDGVGSNDLLDPVGDGLLSENLFIGVSPVTGNDPGDVTINQVADAVFLEAGEQSTTLWARVDNDSRLDTIWIEIKPPGYTPLGSGGSEQVAMDLTRAVGIYKSGTARYEWDVQGVFLDPGTYQIFYFAKDVNTGNLSPLIETRVYKAKDANAIPAQFSLIAPDDDAEVLTSVLLDWEDTTDPDGDPFSYTVLLSKGDPTFSNPIRKEGLSYSTCLVRPDDGIEDLSDYYWKVLAVDEFGATRETEVRVFYTNNTNPVWPGWIKGHVYDSVTTQSISGALIRVGESYELSTEQAGYYLGQVPAGTYTITATKEGYQTKSYADIEIPSAGWPPVTKDFGLVLITAATVKGDINGDDSVDLADAILALKVSSKVDTGTEIISSSSDVNGDERIGLEEVIFLLQFMAGLRTE